MEPQNQGTMACLYMVTLSSKAPYLTRFLNRNNSFFSIHVSKSVILQKIKKVILQIV